MECDRDSEFNDDSSSIDEKTKESILLMKKKMLRSHDLILQYNNKLKECERLKGDLCSSQEEAAKFKRENSANLAKVVKLEMLNAEYKKSQQDFERRLADKDIQIASDKCHLQQLACKVDDIEDKHSEKLMELELEKSSLEVKVKNLEQELKALKKSHLSEVNKLEKAINGPSPKPRKGTIKVVKDTKEIGVNTVKEPEPAKPVKPAMAEKSVWTDEFYHITDNPYPLFCDKCETSIEPSVEKICKIMTSHPPLLTEMLSPVRRHENPSANLSRTRRETISTDSNNINLSNNALRRSGLDFTETSIDFNRVDSVPRNFVSPIDCTITNYQPTSVTRPLDVVNPEIENLRRKVETLERKMKKRKRQNSSEAHPTNANCCGQSRSHNCCGHGQAHTNQVPNLFANGQLDMMTEFWKRMTMFTNEPASTLERPRKTKKNRKTKLQRLRMKGKLKSAKKLKNCGSSAWEIESEDCEAETNIDNLESTNSHILRIKPGVTESRESSPMKIVPDRSDKSTENGSYVETASNRASPVKVPDKPEDDGRISVSSFSDVENANMDVESSNHQIIENPELTNSKLPRSQIQNSSDGETTNFSQDTESAYFSHNSAGDETASISHETDSRTNCFDENFKTALPTEKSVSSTKKNLRNSRKSSIEKSVSICSDTDVSDAPAEEDFDADFQDRLPTRKRKRSFSPKATKRTTRSMDNLFGKMRALKKNTVVGAAKTRRSTVYETRNRRKITNGAQTEEHDGETVSNGRAASICESEPEVCVPAKKQRIAHVPKNERTSQEPENRPAKKSRQSVKQIGKKIDEKSPKGPKPTTRSSILGETKSDEVDTKSCEKSTSENMAIEVCRQERTRAKRNTLTDSPLSLDQPTNRRLEDPDLPNSPVTSSIIESPSPPVIGVSKEILESPYNRDNLSREISEDHEDPEKAANIPKEIFNDHKDPEKSAHIAGNIPSPSEESNDIGQSLGDKTPRFIETKLREISDVHGVEPNETHSQQISAIEEQHCLALLEESNATIESDSSEAPDEQPISKVPFIDSNQIVEFPKAVSDESEVHSMPRESTEASAELALPTETVDCPASPASGEIDSPASPVSCSSLEKFPTDPATTALSPIRSPLYSNVKLAQSSTLSHSESTDEKSSKSAAKNLDYANPNESATDLPNPTKSILFQKLTEPSSTFQPDFSKDIVSPPKTLDDPQTAHPENTQRQFSNHHLPALPETRPVSHAKNRQQRLSTNKTALQFNPQVVSTTTLSNNSSAGPKETRIAGDHVQVDISSDTTSATSLNNSAEKSSNAKLCDTTEIVSSVPKSTKIAENYFGVQITADTPSPTTSSNNVAEKSSGGPKICKMSEKVSMPAQSTKESGRVLVVYDESLQKDVDRELDAEIDTPSQFFVDTPDERSKKKKKTKCSANDGPATTKVLKELRSRQVLSGPATAVTQRNSPATKHSQEESVDRVPYSRKIVCPGTLLGRHLGALQRKSKVTKERRTAAMELYAAAEKTVKAELDKLVESEEWTSELHQSVIARLTEVHSRRTVAKSIVDLLVERAALDEALDRTYTPPAPVMTKSQQRIATLLNGLDRDGIMPGVFELVQDGIEFTLFRLSNKQEGNVVEGLVRMFTVMARMKKDRQRVRILCCDALYCLTRAAFIVLQVVLSVWPEAFPMHGSCEDELPNCIAHLIKMEQGPKTLALKRLITAYYGYPQTQAPSGVIMKGLMQALRKNYTDDLEVAVLLLAKREGPDWTYDNIVNGGLIKMVDDSSYPSTFNALSLLGFIMRTFPLADPLGVMENIGDKLYKIMESGEAPPDQQEGVISALLSLSRRISQFEKITNIVLNWRPTQAMRTRTIEQVNGLFKMRAPGYWTMHNHLRLKYNNTSGEKNDGDEKGS